MGQEESREFELTADVGPLFATEAEELAFYFGPQEETAAETQVDEPGAVVEEPFAEWGGLEQWEWAAAASVEEVPQEADLALPVWEPLSADELIALAAVLEAMQPGGGGALANALSAWHDGVLA